MKYLKITLASMLLLSVVHAQDDAKLGTRFTGPYDISFQPFADARRIERQVPTEIVRYTQDDKKWSLVFDSADLPREIPLRDTKDARGDMQAGYLTAAVNTLRSGNAQAEILRSEVLELGDFRIGLIVAHAREKNQYVLFQQAICEISPRRYCSLVMISPAPEKNFDQDLAVREAGQAFKAIVDSIKRVDLTAIRQDQEDRLIRTRGLFANWNAARLTKTLLPEQMLRFVREGKDIGYAYIVEQPSDGLPRTAADPPLAPDQVNGVRVGMRIRTTPEPGQTVDVESWMYVSFDRRHEVWSHLTVFNNPSAKNEKDKQQWITEVGSSDKRREREFDAKAGSEDFKDHDAGQDREKPLFREVEKYLLTVRTESRSGLASPVTRQLPVFYLPQALGALLPRLVPIDQPTSYAFASFDGPSTQVMFRYIDVLQEQDVTLDGKKVRAVGVSDRLGLQGEPTTHYLSRDGKYVGSINNATKLEIIPTDRATLARLWPQTNLTQPDLAQPPVSK